MKLKIVLYVIPYNLQGSYFAICEVSEAVALRYSIKKTILKNFTKLSENQLHLSLS